MTDNNIQSAAPRQHVHDLRAVMQPWGIFAWIMRGYGDPPVVTAMRISPRTNIWRFGDVDQGRN